VREVPLIHVPSDLALAAAHAGSPFMLCLRQFAFPHNALMLFVCTLDAIFELAPIVRQLFGHFVGPARHIATDCGPDVHGLASGIYATASDIMSGPAISNVRPR
jgi:hypothetical protein